MAIAFDLGTAAEEVPQHRESHSWENNGFGGFRKSSEGPPDPSLLAACSCVDGTNIDSSGYASRLVSIYTSATTMASLNCMLK